MPQTPQPKRIHARRFPTGLLALLGVALMVLGCMMGDDASTGGEFGTDMDSPELMEAQAELARHHVDQAQAIYSQVIAEDTNPPGEAFAGKAITDLLLLPGSDAVSTILVEHLNATRGVDANALVYADEGFIYWALRGVPWEDQGSYMGVRSLLSGRLPWSEARLSGVQPFFESITDSLNLATADLVGLADAMASIQQDIDRAVSDPYFDAIYIPGLTFHSEQLDLFLGRAELQLVSAGVSMVRGGLYFVSAYDYDFSLDDVLGSQSQARQEPQPDWGVEDYAYAFADSRVMRDIHHAERLLQAREAFDLGLGLAISAIQGGTDTEYETSVRWGQAEAADAQRLVALLASIQRALDGPSPLPESTPETTLDLSSFFEGGRTLDPSTDWFVREVDPDITVSVQDENGDWVEQAYVEWRVTEDALQAFFLDGVFEPAVGEGDELPTTAVLDDGSAEDYLDAVIGSLLDRVNEVF